MQTTRIDRKRWCEKGSSEFLSLLVSPYHYVISLCSHLFNSQTKDMDTYAVIPSRQLSLVPALTQNFFPETMKE